METFYDGDFKDIWDSDYDPTESLKISTESYMHEWFLDKDVKDPTVILNDKLISDALLNGTVPIKTEHSYSLNSDGDSLPDSPRSLQTKIDDMEDECYPAIPLKTVTSNICHTETATIDPKCLTISTPSTSLSCSPALVNALHSGNSSSSGNPMVNATPVSMLNSPTGLTFHNSQTSLFSSLSKLGNGKMTINLHGLPGHSSMGGLSSNSAPALSFTKHSALHKQQQHQQKFSTALSDNYCSSPTSSCDGTSSPDICSDIEIDESCIKDEPMSPDSSCPPSPTSASASGSLNLSMANMAAFTNSELVFEHKNGCLQLTPASQSLLKSQQLLLGSSSASSASTSNIIIPKLNIKTESLSPNSTYVASAPAKNRNGNAFGLPLTPPSSLPSDASDGNLTPEHLVSPLSPNTSVAISVASTAMNGPITTSSSGAAMRRNASLASATANANCLSSGRNISGGSTRQPIHTPLISSQPKGSTGTLILTEEEKRTLLAEGYPIPQKMPLTKAEEKSLKKIRRKIKNKISAQESRRKKKEYMDQLERRVEVLVNENSEYRKRVETLEDSNTSLLSQLHKFQALVNKQNMKK